MQRVVLILTLSLSAVLPGAVASDEPGALGERAKAVLLRTLGEERGLVQIHAADALVAFGDRAVVRSVYEGQLPIDPASPFRVGAWRSLAGAARTPVERAQWVEKIESEFLDRVGTLRVGAIESLCKIGHVISGDVLAAAYAMAATGTEAETVFVRWALHLAGDRAALGRVADALKSDDPVARLRAAYVLRWVGTRDAALLAKLAAAVDVEPVDSIARVHVLSAALALEAVPARVPEWTRAAESLVAEGTPGARYEICQTMMRRAPGPDLARYVALLDHDNGDVRIAGAWLLRRVLGRSTEAREGGFKVPETKIISRHPQYFHGWPTMTIHDGKLLVVYSGGREDHVCPFGRVEMIVSRDGGATWAWPQVLLDSAIDDRDTSILRTSRGTLLLGYYGSLAYQGHLVAPERRMARMFGADLATHLERWRSAELATTAEEKQRLKGPWMLRSDDGGVTWSAPLAMPCFTPHGPTQLADGTLFYAGADGKKAGAWISKDDGLTWSWLADIPVRAGEMHAIEAADRTIIVQVRDKVPLSSSTNGGAVMTNTGTLQTESRDGGRTWTTAHAIGVRGYPSHLLRRKNDTLVMTYGYRMRPYGVRARMSRDHGRTWEPELILTNDGASDDLGYPTTVELPDGELITVWYEVMASGPLAALRQARWTLP